VETPARPGSELGASSPAKALGNALGLASKPTPTTLATTTVKARGANLVGVISNVTQAPAR